MHIEGCHGGQRLCVDEAASLGEYRFSYSKGQMPNTEYKLSRLGLIRQLQGFGDLDLSISFSCTPQNISISQSRTVTPTSILTLLSSHQKQENMGVKSILLHFKSKIEKIQIFPVTSIGQNLDLWPHLAAREDQKCRFKPALL